MYPDEPVPPPEEPGELTPVSNETCPKCGSPLGEVIETKSGKKLQRCSTSTWNAETKETEGCDFVKWLTTQPKELEEKCPKCGAPLMEITSRFGKKAKRCSTNKWDPATKTSTGCDYIEWMNGKTEELDEECPKCGEKLVKYTSAAGKQMKKCSTNKWDPKTKEATGCDFIEWI